MTTQNIAVPQSHMRPGFASLRALARRIFGRKELSAEEILALWERQKVLDQLSSERHDAMLRHFPIGRVF